MNDAMEVERYGIPECCVLVIEERTMINYVGKEFFPDIWRRDFEGRDNEMVAAMHCNTTMRARSAEGCRV